MPLSRRTFLLGAGAVTLATVCGGDDDDDDAAPTTSPTSGTDPQTELILGAAFDRNALLIAGIPQRAPFLLFESTGGVVGTDAAPAELTFELVPDGGGDPLPPVTVARHGEDIDRAYFPLQTTVPTAGLYAARVEVDGVPLEFPIAVNDPGVNSVAQIGDPLHSVTTPTVDNPLGVQTLCTAEPACPFHTVSVDAALAAGTPLAVLVSTPAYCQVAICGPVLELLIEAAPGHAGVTPVHFEVYPNGPPTDAASVAPGVVDFVGLNYEPVLFVADSSGVVTARLDNIYDSAELDEALRSAVA